VILASLDDHPSYEYVSDRGKLISACGLQSLVHISYRNTLPVFVMDNHNHAFYFWHLARFQKII